MSTLREILRHFRLNVFVIGGAWWTAYVIALVAGFPAVPLFAVAMVLGTVLAVLLAPGPREAVLRHITRRPRRIMTPDDYRHLREMEIELGWEPSEPLMPVPEPVRPARKAAARRAEPECMQCRQGYEAHRRTGTITSAGSVPLSGTAALSGTGTLSAKATWDDVAYASEASEHFAQLARVGRESCIGPCPMCEERDRRGGGSGRVTVVYHSGTADGAVTAGGGGGTSESAWQPEPPAGSYDFHFDSADREWCRDADGLCWIKPAPDGPWYRQNKSGGD